MQQQKLKYLHSAKWNKAMFNLIRFQGLQELADTIKSTEPDSLKPLLPIWPRFYNVLATDVDNRVREAIHKTHHQLVLKVKRNIAPYLKQLMAPWFTSQYDTYPPAASAASQAFSVINEFKYQIGDGTFYVTHCIFRNKKYIDMC